MVLLLAKPNKALSGHLMGLNGSQPLLLSSPKPTFGPYDTMVGSSFGWLVIAAVPESGLRLLSAISGQQILLLSTTSDGAQIWHKRRAATCFTVGSVALSSAPTSGDCILVARGYLIDASYLAYFRLGRDREWTKFTDHHHFGNRKRMAFHNGELIVTQSPSSNGIVIFNFDYHEPNSRTFCMKQNRAGGADWYWYRSVFVSSGGELLLVVVHHKKPEVFKLGPVGWEVLECLGDRVLLIGSYASESFCTRESMGSGFEPNCIYYLTDDRLTKFSMADRSKEMITIPLLDHEGWNDSGFEWVVTHA